MKLSIGSVINMTPAPSGVWIATFQLAAADEPKVCPVIGWATVVTAHLKDGSASTEVQPAFVWGSSVWTETELREHSPELTAFNIRGSLNDLGSAVALRREMAAHA